MHGFYNNFGEVPGIWYDDSSPMAETRDPERILVVVLDNLGDAVMGSALLGPLRCLFPGAGLGLLVKEYARGVFDLDPASVRVHAADPFWDKAPGRPPGSAAAFLRALGEVRAARYDTALILNADWKRSLACLWAGISLRVGHRRRRSGLFLTSALPEPSGPAHVVSEHAELLAQWCGRPLPPTPLRPMIGLSSAQRESGERWRAELGWQDSPVVAVHAITGDPEKNWPLGLWRGFLEALSRAHPACRFAVLSAPREEALLREAFAGLPAERLRVISCGVSGMKPYLAQADLFVGGDSGPGHMAAALGAPVLSLFGSTDPARYSPCGDLVETLHSRPLSALPVEDVLARSGRLLATSSGRGSSRGRCTS